MENISLQLGRQSTVGSFNLYWQNLESGETLELVEDVSDMRPAISGDGNVVAYVQEVNGISQISVVDRGAQPEPTYFLSGRVTGQLAIHWHW